MRGVRAVHSEHLLKYFGQFGQILNAYIIFDPDSRQSRGFGYVEFSTVDEAKRVLHTPDHEISGRKLTVENHKNGLSNAQFLQSQESREQAVEPHGRFREAKAHRSPVSEAGIAYLPRTMQPYAVRAKFSDDYVDFKEFSNGMNPKQVSSQRMRVTIPALIIEREICSQQIQIEPTPNKSPQSVVAAFSSTRFSSKKASSAMCDLLKRHLSGSAAKNLSTGHPQNDQSLRFNLLASDSSVFSTNSRFFAQPPVEKRGPDGE